MIPASRSREVEMKDSVEKEASTWYTDHHGRLELGPTGRSGNGIKYASELLPPWGVRELGYSSTKFLSINCEVILRDTINSWHFSLLLCKPSGPHWLEKASRQRLAGASKWELGWYAQKWQVPRDMKDIKSVCQWIGRTGSLIQFVDSKLRSRLAL